MIFELLAQVDLKTSIKINDTQSVGEVFDNPVDLINLLVPNIFIIAGTVMLFLLIGGGFTIITGGGAEAVNKGKQQITLAILGFLIMFGAYWIIQIIELITGVKILSPTI